MNLARTTITLSEGLLNQVRQEARHQRRSVSSIVEERLRLLIPARMTPTTGATRRAPTKRAQSNINHA